MLSLTVPRNGFSFTTSPMTRARARQHSDRAGAMVAREYTPRADIFENKDNIVVRLEMPGLDPEDIDVSFDKDVLTVAATRKAPERTSGEVYHSCELAYGAVSRAFTLAARVDREGIDASYINGILTITLPKAAESKPKSIAVKVA